MLTRTWLHVVAGVASLAALAGAQPDSTVVHRLPMQSWGGRPAVAVMINGKGPFRLLVDTGTLQSLVIERSACAAAGLALGGASAEQPVDFLSVQVDTLAIGGLEFNNVSGVAVDLGLAARGGDDPPVGILGLTLFEEKLLTFDFARQEIRVQSGKLSKEDCNALPYSPDPQKDYGITVPIRVAGYAINAHVDTGSPGNVTLLTTWREKLPLKGEAVLVGKAQTPTSVSDVYAATIDGEIKLGPHTLPTRNVSFANLGPMVDTDAGNIGCGVLSEFLVTVDQKNRLIRFEPPQRDANDGATAKPVYRVGIAFGMAPGTLCVEQVLPGGAGAKAGLKPGRHRREDQRPTKHRHRSSRAGQDLRFIRAGRIPD